MANDNDAEIQFFDNFIPKLHSGTYTISVSQSLVDSSSAVVGGPFTNSQEFIVHGPHYQIPAADVHAMFPPRNLAGRFEESLPHVVFNKKSLPWEQIFDEGNENVPWLALVACQIGSGAQATATVKLGKVTAINLATGNSGGCGYHEMPPTVSIIDSGGAGATAVAIVNAVTGAIAGFTVIDQGSGYSPKTIVKIGYPQSAGVAVAGANQSGAFATTVSAVIAPGNDLNENPILGPVITAPSTPTQCNAINLATASFSGLVPRYDTSVSPVVDEISPLAHVRQVDLNNKSVMGLSNGWCANVMAKRFPVAGTQSVNYAIHVISLLGLEEYLTPTASFGSSDLIQVISLYSWSCTCQPETGETFKQLMLDLTTTEQGSDYLLRLPTLPITRGAAPAAATQRAADLVSQGYVPMAYNTRQGEQNMAFYRSPLTPVLPKNFTRGCVTDLKMLNKGTGYTSVPVVSVSGGGIEVATASAPALPDMENGNTLTITSGGNGYLSSPRVNFVSDSLKQATASATITTDGRVSHISVDNEGAGFTSTPDVTIEGGGIKAALASAYLQVGSIKLDNGGSGYSSAPTVIIKGGGGSGAAAEAVVDTAGSIQSITLIASGSGYTSTPAISFVPSTGSATATAIMALGMEVQLASGGFGYAQAPEVELTGGLPLAAATVSLSGGSVDSTSVVFSNNGLGYISAPTVTLSGGVDAAQAVAQVANGIIVGVTLITRGSNYTSAPTVTSVGSNTSATLTAEINGILSINVAEGGAGYTNPVTFTFSGSPTRVAAVTAVLSPGSIMAVPVNTPGSGYNNTAPEVSFTGGNGDASAVAVLSSDGDSIDHISMTSYGTGYDSSATVALSAVSGATAATLDAPTISSIGAITRAIITDPGAGYSGTVSVSATTAQGSPAPTSPASFDTAVIGTGRVSQILVQDGGSGYESPLELVISGGGLSAATATANLDSATGAVSSLSFASTGSGYASAPTIQFSGGGLNAAIATATLKSGQVTKVTITDPGQGYTTAPGVEFYGGGFSIAQAVAILSGESPNTVAGINLTNPGSGYIYPPQVVISGGGVREASAVANISAGVVSGILIADGGEGYTAAPSAVTLTGGNRRMVAKANLESVVQSLNLVSGGSGYTSIPGVTISAPAGYALTGYTAAISPSTLAALTATADSNVAFQFDTGTTFTVSGTSNMDGSYVCVQAANWSSNTLTFYIDTSLYTLPDAPSVTSGTINLVSDKTATAIAEICGGVVSQLILTEPGSGYTSAPTISIDPPGIGSDNATATATAGTQVGSLTITDPGQGYTYQPTITIDPPGNGTQANARAYINDPIQSSSSAAIYNVEWGVFDLSYSANFLNARLLALNSRSFAVEVLQWRREGHQMVNRLYERLTTADRNALKQLAPGQIRNYMQGSSMTEQVMAALTGDFAKQLLPTLSQPIKPGSTFNADIPPAPSSGTAGTAILDLQQLLQNGDIQTQLQNLSGYNPQTGTFANPRFKGICEWLSGLVLLDGVPFEYLVPDERMLPPGSIRFFYLDPNATEALIDGALSVGTHTSRDTLYYTLMRGVIRDAVQTLLHQVRANLLGQQPSAPPYDDQPITGLLLRSPVVKGWPGLEVKAYAGINSDVDGQPEGQNSIPLLRMSHISKDILLCLFDGVPEWVELDEPGEGLTFGVEDGQLISLRQLTGAATGAQIRQQDGEFATLKAGSCIDSATGVLKLPELISALQDALASESQLTPNYVVRIETDGGEGYTVAPTSIEINGTANGNITAQLNGLAGVVVETGGAGYVEPPAVAITDPGGGTGATAIASVENGKVTAIQLLSLGENYVDPTVGITSANTGAGASATASLDSSKEINIAVASGGSQYIYPPLVTLTTAVGDHGAGAEAVAILDGDSVAQVVVTNQGTNYTQAPTVSFSTGSGATASAVVASGQVTGFTFEPSALGTLSAPPTISIVGATCTQQATATAYLGTLGPADFAVEMVKLPERMIFRIPQND